MKAPQELLDGIKIQPVEVLRSVEDYMVILKTQDQVRELEPDLEKRVDWTVAARSLRRAELKWTLFLAFLLRSREYPRILLPVLLTQH